MTNRKLQHRGLSSQSGQALVELALTLPIMVALLIGAAELAMASYASVEVANAAKAAVQYGAQNSTTAADTTGMKTAAINDAGNLPLTSSDVSATVASGVITVEVSYPFSPPINLPGLPSTFTLHGRAIQEVM